MCVKHFGKNAGENLKSKFSISHAYFWSLDGKIIGGIYDNRFLVKNVKSAREKMPEAELELPYEGVKEMLLVDDVENREFFCNNLMLYVYPD